MHPCAYICQGDILLMPKLVKHFLILNNIVNLNLVSSHLYLRYDPLPEANRYKRNIYLNQISSTGNCLKEN